MLYCYKCGGRLPEDGGFCPYCGAKLPTVPSAEAALQTDPAALRDNQTPYGQNQPPYGYNQPPYGYNQPPYGYNPAPYRYAPAPPRPPAAKPKKPDDPMSRAYRLTSLGTLVTYGMVSQVSEVVLSVAAAILVMVFGSRMFERGSLSVSDLLDNGPFVRIILTVYLFAYVGGLLLGMLVSKTIRRRLPAQPPERNPLSAGAFLRCVLAAFGLWGVGVLIGNFPAFLVPIESMNFGWNSIPLWVLAVVVAPIFEELVFRKLVLDRVGSFGELPAVLCSALIFGLAHQNAGQFFLAFLLGLLFARIYLRTGNIIYTMLLHFMINLVGTFDEVGVLIWGASFELWFFIGLGVLALPGIVLLIVYRRDPILGFPGRLSPEDRRRSLRCWPVTLIKWICLVSIITFGLMYCLLALTGGDLAGGGSSGNPLGLLYLIPAALAVVFVLILTKRPKRQPVPAAEATGNRQQATGYEGGVCRDGTLPSAHVQPVAAAAEATGNRQQATWDEKPACRGGSYPEGEPPAPPEAETSDEASSIRDQAYIRDSSSSENEPEMQNEATGDGQQATGDEERLRRDGTLPSASVQTTSDAAETQNTNLF